MSFQQQHDITEQKRDILQLHIIFQQMVKRYRFPENPYLRD
ncbi:unnamed protein product [Paramecium octaurelia]|uniref:Uncharacterized protein n=1 Tax=Paramecium octaurelia TaxID=43137 RepID=A0A8S1WGW3_PAROT|nr:unnamed protein product [Paramecium octaurelia]